MKLKTTLLKTLAVLCVMAMFLTACGGGGSSAPDNTGSTANDDSAASPAPADAGASTIEPCELTYWFWADSDTLAAKMQEIVDNFNATNEYGITVTAEQQNWDGGGYSTTLINACLGGGGPDMATFKLNTAPAFVENDLLYDMTDMIAAWDDASQISDNIWNIMRNASDTDNIYVMPWNTQVLYIYYRPSIFEAAGITTIPSTYNEFLDAVKTISEAGLTNDAGEKVYGFGMRGGSGGQEPFGTFLFAHGGGYEDMTSAASVAGVQDFIDLYQNGYAPANATEAAMAEMKADFISGRTAMMIHHCGSSVEMMDTFGDDVSAFVVTPAEGNGPGTILSDTDNIILSGTQHPEAAFEFMKYMATGDGEAMWCEASGNVPVASSVQAMDFVQANRFLQISIGGLDNSGIIPCSPNTTEFISAWPNIIAQGLEGSKTAEQVCSELQAILWG